MTVATDNPLGYALELGRVHATVVSKRTGRRVSVRLRVDGGRILCSGEHGDIGTYISASGELLPPFGRMPDNYEDWAARHVIEVAAGRRPLEGENSYIEIGIDCLVCGHPDMTDPESKRLGIGPVCRSRIEQARSGARVDEERNGRPAANRTSSDQGGDAQKEQARLQLRAELAQTAQARGLRSMATENASVPEGLIEVRPGDDPREALERWRSEHG